MSRDPAPTASVARCLAVWSAVTAAAAATLVSLSRFLADRVAEGPTGVPFDALLVEASAAALAGCAAWFWLVATAVVVEAVTGRQRAVPGCPRRVRRAILATCGAALLLGASPAQAEPSVGLPPTPSAGDSEPVAFRLPQRPAPTRSTDSVVVRPGDTLWGIAERFLPEGATDAEVDSRWRAIYRANRDVVGADPDHIEPRMTLHVEKEPR